MHTKLAGKGLPLASMIENVLTGAKEKLAAADAKEDPKKDKKEPAKAKAEEQKEKKSAAILEVDDIEKLASALDEVGDGLMKSAADVQNLGGEKKQGGETLPVGAPVGGTQPYKKDGSKKHQVPMSTPETVASDGGKAKTLVESNENKPPVPLNAAYPKKGVLKTAAGDSVAAKIQALKAKKEGGSEKKDNDGDEDDKKTPPAKVTNFEKKDKKDEDKEKKSSLDFILAKAAEYTGGGELTGESKSEEGPKPPTDAAGGNDARKALSSAQAAINMKKVDGKKPQKRMLAEVLTEPALTKSTDSKVQENLQNAAKGGVKIAAARELLKKVASEGCTCGGKGTCAYCKMQASMKKSGTKEKKSMGTMSPMGGASMPGASTTPVTPAV